jgi:hypothetical protein
MRKSARLAIAALMVTMGATNVNAITTMGGRSCGQWENRAQDNMARLAAEGWLMGFMSGLAIGSSKDVLADPDGASLVLWMDNYCKAHPLEKIGTGGVVLYFELLRRQKP